MNLQELQHADIELTMGSALNAVLDNPGSPTGCCNQNLAGSAIQTSTLSTGLHLDILIQQAEYHRVTRIQARPVFPDSLLSTEVQLGLSSTANTKLPYTMPAQITGVPDVLDYPVENSLYHQLDHPLPDYLGNELYKNSVSIICILENNACLRTSDTALIPELQSVLYKRFSDQKDRTRLSIPVFTGNEIPQEKKDRRGQATLSLNGCYKLAHPYHRLNVIAKSRLVACDSPGVAADAIRASVPAVFLTEVPTDFENVQRCITRFLRHADWCQLLQEQQAALQQIIHHRCQNTYVMSNENTLNTLITAYLNQDNVQLVIEKLKQSATPTRRRDDLILSSQQSLFSKATNKERLRSGLAGSQRKYRKLKESPTRFIHDSQNRILRSLVTRKTSQ